MAALVKAVPATDPAEKTPEAAEIRRAERVGFLVASAG